jgi:Kef-type K+ transport system membrane component KefB
MEGATSDAVAMVAIGLFLLVGFGAHVIGQRAHVPRVTLLLIVGVLVGPEVLALIPSSVSDLFPFVAEVALSMVGFMLGEQFLGRRLRQLGKKVVTIAAVETVITAAAVFAGLWLAGVPLALALPLAGVAPASAPAATVDVVRESRAKGPLTDIVLGVVAVDDAFGIVAFSVLLVLAEVVTGASWSAEVLGAGLLEVGGGIALGALLGFPMAWLTGRVRPGELTLMETLGFVLLTGGLANLAGVSYLLACMALGAVVANRAKHHTRPFHAIENVSQPFLVLFFLMAGFELKLSALPDIGVVGGVYVAMRALGKIAGGWLGATLAGASKSVRRHVGACLWPQAGVALGLALLAAQRVPAQGEAILTVLVATTFVFELIGPVAARVSLGHAGETGRSEPDERDESDEPDESDEATS